MMTIVPAYREPQLSQARVLFREYVEALGFHLCFQDVEQEMADLAGRYGPPDGALLIAQQDTETAGCVAMKKLGEGVCEMKRFFVRPAFRGHGIGLQLAEAIIAAARAAGYREMRLDTVPSMASAIRIYESLGFKDTEPYVFNPVEGVRYLALQLR